MGVRAVTEWPANDGTRDLYCLNGWLSPHTFVPSLADYVTAAQRECAALSSEGYRAWAEHYDPRLIGRPLENAEIPGDAEYHYLVSTAPDAGPDSFSLRIRTRPIGETWRETEHVTTVAALHTLAAALFRKQATHIRRLIREGRPPRFGLTPDQLIGHAEEFEARARRAGEGGNGPQAACGQRNRNE